MAGFYDLVLLIDPNAPEERRTAAVSEAESLLGSGGEIVESQDWGQKRMAYEIDHRPEAEYRLYQFNGDNALLDRLNQRLRINDAVLRFRIIKAKPGQPLPPPPEQQSPRRRDDREPQDTRVAARAAADAPSPSDAPAGEDAPAPEGAAPEGATEAAPAEAAPTETGPTEAAPAPEPPPAAAADEEAPAADAPADAAADDAPPAEAD
jgi:small subunit ribosomal protein S6